jgi:hypothetical protein
MTENYRKKIRLSVVATAVIVAASMVVSFLTVGFIGGASGLILFAVSFVWLQWYLCRMPD